MERINLRKQVYPKNEVNNVINTNFTEFTLPNIQTVVTASIEEFFTQYQTLFFQIPKFGNINSHEYLIKTSQAYVGSVVVNDEIVLLQQEITQLRRQLIEIQREPVQLISQTLQTSGLNLPQLTLPELPPLPSFESPDTANAALDPNSTLSTKDLRKKQREERRAARRARRAQNNS